MACDKIDLWVKLAFPVRFGHIHMGFLWFYSTRNTKARDNLKKYIYIMIAPSCCVHKRKYSGRRTENWRARIDCEVQQPTAR